MLAPGGIVPFGMPTETCWRSLRRVRANPPGAANTAGPRRETFNASLEQFEQLLKAAASTGPVARPITVFYGLSQAGRAIAAAANSVPDQISNGPSMSSPWMLSGHGIQSPGLSATAAQAGVSLGDFPLVNSKGGGSFTRLAEILDSGSLVHKVLLAHIWDTLPESFTHELNKFADYPVLGFTGGGLYPIVVGAETGQVEGVPTRVRKAADPCTALTDFLTRYPTLDGYRLNPTLAEPEWQLDGTGQNLNVVQLAWPTNHPGKMGLNLEDRVARCYRGDYYVFPTQQGSDKPLHPLLAWWAVLYLLSMLARYEPRAWYRLVNIDSSREASPIEHILTSALEALPHLVVDVIGEVTAPQP